MDDIDIILSSLEKRRDALPAGLWEEKDYKELDEIREINKRIFFFLKGKRAVFKNCEDSFTEAMNDYEKTQKI